MNAKKSVRITSQNEITDEIYLNEILQAFNDNAVNIVFTTSKISKLCADWLIFKKYTIKEIESYGIIKTEIYRPVKEKINYFIDAPTCANSELYNVEQLVIPIKIKKPQQFKTSKMKNKKQIKKLKLEVKNWANNVLFLQKRFDQQNINFDKRIQKLESDCAKKIYELILKVNDLFEQQKIKDEKQLLDSFKMKIVSPSLLDTFDRLSVEQYKKSLHSNDVIIDRPITIQAYETIDRLQKEIIELKANQLPKKLDVEKICNRGLKDLISINNYYSKRGLFGYTIFQNDLQKIVDYYKTKKSNIEIKKDILDSALNIENKEPVNFTYNDWQTIEKRLDLLTKDNTKLIRRIIDSEQSFKHNLILNLKELKKNNWFTTPYLQ